MINWVSTNFIVFIGKKQDPCSWQNNQKDKGQGDLGKSNSLARYQRFRQSEIQEKSTSQGHGTPYPNCE